MILDNLKDFKFYGHIHAEHERAGIILSRIDTILKDFVDTEITTQEINGEAKFYLAVARWNEGLYLTNRALNQFLRDVTNDMVAVMPIEEIRKNYSQITVERGYYPLMINLQLLDGSKNPGQLQLKTRSFAMEQLTKMRDRLVDEYLSKKQKIENLTSDFRKNKETEVRNRMWNHLDSVESWLCTKGGIPSMKLGILKEQLSNPTFAQ